MAKTLVEQVMEAHLVSGDLVPGAEVALKIDHTLTQDATGTLAYLEFEAMGVDRARPEVAVSYVDHNLLQTDFRNADDHRFLRTIAAHYGLYFSPPGNGISHQVHLERFSVPGKTLLGSDSHTPTAGGAGHAGLRRRRPGRRPGPGRAALLSGHARDPGGAPHRTLPGLGVGQGRYPGVAAAPDGQGGPGQDPGVFRSGPARTSVVPERAAITNMGAELGATTSIFPADAQTRQFMALQGREADFRPLKAQGRPGMPGSRK